MEIDDGLVEPCRRPVEEERADGWFLHRSSYIVRRPHLRSGSNSSPTTSVSCRAEWRMGCAVYGSRGGLGKTRVVLATLKEEGLKPLVLNGHITPLSLYANLYERPDSVLFLDDCDSLFRNLPALGILRSALWGETNEKRLVTYNSQPTQDSLVVLLHRQNRLRDQHVAHEEPCLQCGAEPCRPV